MCDKEKLTLKELEIIAIFGFDGQISAGLKVHPDLKHIIFPLGNKVSILNFETNVQSFLCGHTNTISTIDISPTGSMVASGQINHMGFRAYVFIWDWRTQKEIVRHELHKVRVEALCFTAYEKYLISLGGSDCGQILVWDIEKGGASCSSTATKETSGDATRLCKLNRRAGVFISGGKENLRLWCVDKETRKLTVQDVAIGKLRREFTGLTINSRDELMYVGTMSGDIVKIRLNCHHDPEVVQREKQPVLLGCFAKHNPKKAHGKDCEKYINGVRELLILSSGQIIVGAGDGTVELIEERAVNNKEYPSPTWPQFKSLKRTKVNSAVSSFQLMGPDFLIIGTQASEIYTLKISIWDLKLVKTCHTSAVYDIAFPRNFPVVFATASYQSIRIWSTTKMQELLRILVPNFTASSIVFGPDGKSIISAWNDGVIRAFTPLTGRLIYSIPNAHNKGVSALTVSSNGRILVSGGCEGQVRVWKIEPFTQSLVGVLKEHVGPVGTVHFNCFDTEVVSSSSDGTCIIWDITRLSRQHVLFANTQFTCARYFPNGVQVLASGSDRRVSYWEVYDGSLVRDVEGSTRGPINCVDMNYSGEYFVSVGHDQIVRLWDYQQGLALYAGYGHAAIITVGKFSPCGQFFVTGSADGAIHIWKMPEELLKKSAANELESRIGTPKSSKSSVRSKKSNKSNKSITIEKKLKPAAENITQLESTRENKTLLCCQCPADDGKNYAASIKSNKSRVSVKSGK